MKFRDVYQAIETEYFPPTNYRCSKIIARAAAGRVQMSYEYGLNMECNHKLAAKMLADKFGWNDERDHWVSGQLHNGNYVHVQFQIEEN